MALRKKRLRNLYLEGNDVEKKLTFRGPMTDETQKKKIFENSNKIGLKFSNIEGQLCWRRTNGAPNKRLRNSYLEGNDFEKKLTCRGMIFWKIFNSTIRI